MTGSMAARRGPPFEFALDLRGEAALLASRIDLELMIGWSVPPAECFTVVAMLTLTPNS
jgi:hypothetical protein